MKLNTDNKNFQTLLNYAKFAIGLMSFYSILTEIK